MQILKLTQGLVTRVCDCHYWMVRDYKWCASRGARGKFYAFRMQKVDGKYKGFLMHRYIMEPPDDMVIDHKNGDTLDNQCSNLRICTQGQNALNNRVAKKGSVSGHKGVYWHKAAEKWCAEVVFNHKKYYLGVFKNKLDAVEAYNKKAKELHGEFYSPS